MCKYNLWKELKVVKSETICNTKVCYICKNRKKLVCSTRKVVKVKYLLNEKCIIYVKIGTKLFCFTTKVVKSRIFFVKITHICVKFGKCFVFYNKSCKVKIFLHKSV